MSKLVIKNPQFIKTATKPSEYPKLYNESGELLPEVAVVGRSNVGKSTLLNHLFNHKGMAKTSSTPGKTRAINFFTVSDRVSFADLPGYGYAKVSKSERADWGPMMEKYFTERATLKLILFLFDIRRTPNADDLQMLEWLEASDKPGAIIFTKADKVTRSQRAQYSKKILAELGLEEHPAVMYSATKNMGRQELIKIIEEGISS